MGNWKKEQGKKYLVVGSMLSLVVIPIVCITIGAATIPLADTLRILLQQIPFLDLQVDIKNYPASYETIIWQVRMPRLILALLVGAALGTVGGALQGLLKNPMADPYILGVSAGASLGAALAIALRLNTVLGFLAIPICAFAGALLSIFIIYHLGKVGNGFSVYTLLLAGVALSSFFTALTSFVIVLHSKETHQIIYWMMGGFSGTTWFYVQIAAPIILGGIFGLNCFARELNAMLFGDHTAQSLGIELNRVRAAILVLAAFTTAAGVAVSGTIGFVGLIIPHIVRLFLGPDHRILLPASAVTGGIFMVMTDTAARTVLAPSEIPVGIITALFGGPFFIYLLRKHTRKLF